MWQRDNGMDESPVFVDFRKSIEQWKGVHAFHESFTISWSATYSPLLDEFVNFSIKGCYSSISV